MKVFTDLETCRNERKTRIQHDSPILMGSFLMPNMGSRLSGIWMTVWGWPSVLEPASPRSFSPNRKGVPHSLVHNQSRINWVGECTPSHTQADEFTPKLHTSWWIHTKNCTWPDLFTPKLHLHQWTHTQTAWVDKFTPKLCMNRRIHTQTAHELMNSHPNCTWTGDFTHKLRELINSHPNCTWSDEFMPKVHMYWWIYNQTAHEPINSHPKRSWTD